MKMPDEIDLSLIAVCGMNCTVCYKHLVIKKYAKQCRGCKFDDETLPAHCRKCAIKDCANSRRLGYCFQCGDYPCKRIKNLDKSYQKRYQTSLAENGRMMKEDGMPAFLAREREKWSCPVCGGIISLHDRFCSECGTPIE